MRRRTRSIYELLNAQADQEALSPTELKRLDEWRRRRSEQFATDRHRDGVSYEWSSYIEAGFDPYDVLWMGLEALDRLDADALRAVARFYLGFAFQVFETERNPQQTHARQRGGRKSAEVRGKKARALLDAFEGFRQAKPALKPRALARHFFVMAADQLRGGDATMARLVGPPALDWPTSSDDERRKAVLALTKRVTRARKKIGH